jgi:pentatricopeptide repeat protein
VTAGELDQAVTLFDRLQSAGLTPGEETYNTLLKGCAKLPNYDLANQLFARMKATPGLTISEVAYNSMIEICVK